MRRLPVLGCALLLAAGCGGGGGGGGSAVEEMLPMDPPAPVRETTLRITGESLPAPADTNGDAVSAVFYNWGAWGGVLRDDMATCTAIGCPPAGDEIFWAYLNSEADGTVTATVHGAPSGTSPVSGSAVWSGHVHAYATETVATSGASSAAAHAPVKGDARLEVDFAAATVDVEFTGFGHNRAALSWPSLPVDGGAFGNAAAGLEGAFYGAGHEGAAGTFERDGLTGVFGALRASE